MTSGFIHFNLFMSQLWRDEDCKVTDQRVCIFMIKLGSLFGQETFITCIDFFVLFWSPSNLRVFHQKHLWFGSCLVWFLFSMTVGPQLLGFKHLACVLWYILVRTVYLNNNHKCAPDIHDPSFNLVSLLSPGYRVSRLSYPDYLKVKAGYTMNRWVGHFRLFFVFNFIVLAEGRESSLPPAIP